MTSSLKTFKQMENEKEVVKQEEELTPTQKQEDLSLEEDKTDPTPGSKTPPELLLKSLKEEREKIKALEEQKRELEEKLKSSDLYGEDEDLEDPRKLQSEINALKERFNSIEAEKELEQVFREYPVLKEKQEEFADYRKDLYPDAKIGSVAKLFLADNDFFTPKRQGLEKPTGGDKNGAKSGMSSEDVESIRKNDYKRYKKLLMEGKIKISK